MPLLQLFLSALFIMAFFVVLFIVAWYIALPLVILWGIVSLFYWIRARVLGYRTQKVENGCTIRTYRQKQTDSTIIDVDYTELDN